MGGMKRFTNSNLKNEEGLKLPLPLVCYRKKPERFNPFVVGLMVLMIIVAVFFAGCQQYGGGIPTPAQVWAPRAPGRMAPGDVVRFTYPGAPEFNQTQRVRADGRLTLPGIGEITAEGKRPGDLQAELGRLYSSQLKDNEVMVSLENSATPVYVSGAVRTPGRSIIDRPMTAFEAIMEAGGFDADYADTRNVVVVRSEGGRHNTRVIDMRPALLGRSVDVFYLRPYDVVYVPRSLF